MSDERSEEFVPPAKSDAIGAPWFEGNRQKKKIWIPDMRGQVSRE
jgi:hypothetical protein